MNGVDVGGAEEEVEEGVAGGVAVEEREEGPVDEPCAVLQLRKWVVEQLGVDALLHLLHLLEGRLPARCEDLRGQLTPCSCRDLVVICGKDTELVEQIGGGTIVAAAVLEVAEIVKRVDHFDGDLSRSGSARALQPYEKGIRNASYNQVTTITYIMVLLQELQVGNLVTPQVCDDVLPLQQLRDLAGAVLVCFQGLDDLLPLVGKFFGWVLQVLQVTVQVGDVIRHVGLLQQLVLGLEKLARLGLVLGAAIFVFQLGAAELEEREDEVAVELGDQLGEQVEL